MDIPAQTIPRLPFQVVPRDADARRHLVVRPISNDQTPEQPQAVRQEILLRHSLRWLELLRTVARLRDRFPSAVLSQLLREAETGNITRRDFIEQPFEELLMADRGQPFADGTHTANRLVGVHRYPPGEPGNGWATYQVGELADQSYFLQATDIATLELLAERLDTTPGQVADVLIARHLSRTWH